MQRISVVGGLGEGGAGQRERRGRMTLTGWLFRLARLSADLTAVSSRKPKRMGCRRCSFRTASREWRGFSPEVVWGSSPGSGYSVPRART